MVRRNTAFVFVKPHAVTDKVKELVKDAFEKKDITIKKEGLIEGEEIDRKQLVDKHYYAIASKATLLKPDKLNIPKEKFKEKFGLDWEEALSAGKALNAKDACEKFDVDAQALDTMWAGAKKCGKLVKFGGGFYCAELEFGDKGVFYVFNGFFMSMRSKFVEEGASIYYYVVEWDPKAFSWEDFRGKVLGPTDPVEAPADSLRGSILSKWKDLDLKSEPNVGDNGVHASASPFEALAERMNWLGVRVERDLWGKMLLKTGLKPKQVREWTTDPQVTFGISPITKSLFDALEDTDSDYCLALCQMIAGNSEPNGATKALETEVESLKAELEKYKALEKAVLAIQSFVPSPLPKTDPQSKGTKKGAVDVEPEKEKGKGKGKKKNHADSEPEEKPPPRKGKGRGKGKSKGRRD
eukprot:TRINITY_DN2017_c0_g1_i9.p1 TRINITY_DN2017_c0_g1~~TRINITY_DN2017_c0_g1_i9.p1  ORF type:complete len:410 (+),score=104.34 TRINITY_DN2017_c0_g1_i9:132-1361(+)